MNKFLLTLILFSVLQFNYKAQCPSLTVTPSSTICQKSNLLLTASSSVACTYSWTGPNGFSTTVQNPTISNTSVTASGIYTVVATFTSPSCQSSAAVNVSVIAVPSIAVIPNITVCERQGASFAASAPNAINYVWAFPNSFTVNIPNPIFSNLLPSMSGAYTVTAMFTTGTYTCYNSNQTVLSVKPAPTLISTNDSLFCTNQTPNPILTLTVTGADTYTWSTSSTATSIVVSPTVTTSYSVVGSYTNGCIDNDTITLTLADCTDIFESSKEESNILIYPNPTKGQATIDIPSESTMFITNMLGKLVYDERLVKGRNIIDIENLSPGVYLLKIMGEKNSRVAKLIKE